MTALTLLVVEDEAGVALDLQSRLQRLGCAVSAVAASAQEALTLVEQVRPDFILMDIGLTGAMDGIEVAEKIRAQYGTPIIFLTAHVDTLTRQRVNAVSPAVLLGKPFATSDLLRSILVALHDGMRYQA